MHHASIRTANIHRAIAFYQLLGFTLEERLLAGKIYAPEKIQPSLNNFFRRRNLIALGADNQWNGSCYTPSLIVDSLSVVG